MCRYFSLLFFVLSITGFKAFPQNNPKTIADSLANYIVPIHHHGSSAFDFSTVVDFLKSKELVSLGESTHGTKEIFDAKVEIIKGLVKTGNFKTIFMETDYCGLLKMDTRLQLSNDTALYQEFINSGLYSIYKTAEVYRLFSWVKDYNRTRAEQDKVSILGIDMQDASTIVNKLLQVLPDSGKNNNVIYTGLTKILNLYASNQPIVFNKPEKQTNQLMIAELKAISGNMEAVDFKYLVQLMDQSMTLIGITRTMAMPSFGRIMAMLLTLKLLISCPWDTIALILPRYLMVSMVLSSLTRQMRQSDYPIK